MKIWCGFVLNSIDEALMSKDHWFLRCWCEIVLSFDRSYQFYCFMLECNGY
jgi:hypothetical protein